MIGRAKTMDENEEGRKGIEKNLNKNGQSKRKIKMKCVYL
jgi:hypothetical protein